MKNVKSKKVFPHVGIHDTTCFCSNGDNSLIKSSSMEALKGGRVSGLRIKKVKK
jgi:hypothetical protein